MGELGFKNLFGKLISSNLSYSLSLNFLFQTKQFSSSLRGEEPGKPPNSNKGKSQKEFDIPNDNNQFLK